MNEVSWQEERQQLLERLRKAEQAEQEWRKIAAESQAEAAVCRDLLEGYYEAARQAIDKGDTSLLPKIAQTSFHYVPTESDTKRWGKYFLRTYLRDAGWLEDTKKALEQIESDAEKLLEDNEVNAALKKKIIATAEKGLIAHV